MLTTAHACLATSRVTSFNSVRKCSSRRCWMPMFTRWRWVAACRSPALSQRRVPTVFAHAGGRLVAAVFLDQIACAENLVGERGLTIL